MTKALATSVTRRGYLSVRSMCDPSRSIGREGSGLTLAPQPSLRAASDAPEADDGGHGPADQQPHGLVGGLAREQAREVGADGIGLDRPEDEEDHAEDENDEEDCLVHASGLRRPSDH